MAYEPQKDIDMESRRHRYGSKCAETPIAFPDPKIRNAKKKEPRNE